MTYNELTNMSAAILPDLFRWANSVTYDWFGVGVLIITWFIIFFNLMLFDKNRAILTATFICGILSIPLYFVSVISRVVLVAAIALTIIALLWMIFTKEDV